MNLRFNAKCYNIFPIHSMLNFREFFLCDVVRKDVVVGIIWGLCGVIV
jgi:hypothetical protein